MAGRAIIANHSQQVVDADACTLAIDVRVNRELEQTLLSFGPQVEVLAPDWFRAQIMEKYQEIVKLYRL